MTTQSHSQVEAAVYARVSSDAQAQEQTIESQIADLRNQVGIDAASLQEKNCFLDDGVSGSTLNRPALERLRDAAYVGQFAEYERAKIMERSRRGKRHAATRGSVNVLSAAPYGYHYITRREGDGQAAYEIDDEQAAVVRQVFQWVGRDRLSIGEVTRRLTKSDTTTATGKVWWDRTTVWGMLKNPAYMGSAAFGKTRMGPRRAQLRTQRGHTKTPRRTGATYDTDASEQLSISVPAIVSAELFDVVQTQLTENRQRGHQSRRDAKYLLQGLLECGQCGYAFYGKPVSRASAKGKLKYAYDRCIGTDAYRFGGKRVCECKQSRTDKLDEAVWNDACELLRHPKLLREEYERRLAAPRDNDSIASLKKQVASSRRSVERLIDAYTDGVLDRTEFEPRLQRARARLAA